MKIVLLGSGFDWLPGDERWWIYGAGAMATLIALVLGTRLLGGSSSQVRQPATLDPAHDPFAVGGQSERRAAHRRKGSCVGVHMCDTPGAPEREGWVLDRSLGGLGLYSEIQVEPGRTLRVRPENAPPMTPWVDVEVKLCSTHETGYRLNCAFVKTPPYAVLLLFG